MADMVLLALRQNLANAERLGDIDRAKRIKARLAEVEKASTPMASAAGPTASVKKAVKKTTAKKAAKK